MKRNDALGLGHLGRTRYWNDTLRSLDMAQGIRARRRFKSGGGGGAVAPAMQYTDANDQAATRLIAAQALPMVQQTQTFAFAAGNNVAQNQTVSIPLNNVGLQTSLIIEVTGTIAQAAAETLTKTAFGLSNIFSNIRVVDFSNVERVNTTSRHLHMLATLRRQNIFGASYTTDSPVAFGSNFAVNSQPSPVTTAQNFRWFIEVPLAYDPYSRMPDLRGALYAGVTNAQWRLQFTFNPNFVVAANATDVLNASYKSSTNGDVGLLTNVKVAVYQQYYDQIPPGKNGQPILPLISLAYNYLLISTTQTGIVQATDFPVQYPNFRMFLSTIVGYDNAGTFNSGSDVNYLGIQVANLLFTTKVDPFRAALDMRNLIGDDLPPGYYGFDHRKKPIVTQTYGNTQFVLNASTVNAGATLEMNYEMMAVQSQAFNAGSLPAT